MLVNEKKGTKLEFYCEVATDVDYADPSLLNKGARMLDK